MTAGVRWGIVVLALMVAASAPGCKFLTKSEYDTLLDQKKLADEYKSLNVGLTKEKDSLTSENQSLQMQIRKLNADVAEQKKLRESAMSDANRAGQLAASATEIARTMSDTVEDLIKRNKDLADKLALPGGGAGGHGVGALGSGITTIYGPEGYGYSIEGDVLFASGMAALKDSAKGKLDAIAGELKKNSEYKIRVCGYTDSDPIRKTAGKWEDNFDLSGARALSVLQYLASKGVPASRMHFAGFGEHALVKSGGKEDKAKSRRAEIWLLTTPAQNSGDAHSKPASGFAAPRPASKPAAKPATKPAAK